MRKKYYFLPLAGRDQAGEAFILIPTLMISGPDNDIDYVDGGLFLSVDWGFWFAGIGYYYTLEG